MRHGHHRRLRFAVLIGALWAAAAGGCAGIKGAPAPGSDGGGGSTPTTIVDAAADVGAGDQASADRTAVPDVIIATGDSMPAPTPDAACATQSAVAERLPVDLYVMMDSSGSMDGLTAAGPTKWEAVRTALTAFLNDPASAGLGIGLQYFPQLQPGVPASCTTDAGCGNFGPCQKLRACYGPVTTRIVGCTANSDCQAGESCVLLGQCPISGVACLPTGALCLTGDICTPAPGFCRARDRCDVPAYATPAVPVAVLPGAAPALIASLTARRPDGLTPTGPALAGALQLAQTEAAANPSHKPAVVFVTDGLPTECTPVDIPTIAGVARAAAMATPSIPTFVIGVFAPDEMAAASTNLDALAQAGGTGSAVVINTNQNVTQALQAALDQIRTTAVACEYKIPPPTSGAIDFGKVNVQVTSTGGAVTTIGYVRGRAGCDAARGGWYYDVDPDTGGTPTSIIACDATCSQFRGDVTVRVDVVLGCKTIVVQ
jgi:Mg-chelatase subunit ChlD